MPKFERKVGLVQTFGITLTHLVAGLAIWYWITNGFSKTDWILFAVLLVITGYGITVGYHRFFAHKGFKCGRKLTAIFAVAGAMAEQGNIRSWVPNHRVHHLLADLAQDPHSPLRYAGERFGRIRGLIWAHMGWLFFKYERPKDFTNRDLDEDPIIRWQERWEVPLIALGYVAPALISGFGMDLHFNLMDALEAMLLAGFFRVFVVWHVTWSVNSICHVFGLEAEDSEGNRFTADDSRNNILIAFLGMGEGYHSNHHAQAQSAYHGWDWWSIDASKWLIILLERAGLVWDVKKPKKDLVFNEKQRVKPDISLRALRFAT